MLQAASRGSAEHRDGASQSSVAELCGGAPGSSAELRAVPRISATELPDLRPGAPEHLHLAPARELRELP